MSDWCFKCNFWSYYIANSFILLTMTSDLHISEKKVRQTIKRIKADKALNISDISNRALQTDLAELILILMSLFNVCVIHRYHSKQFKKAQMIVLCKLKKSDYTDSKTYQLIALLDIMSKALKLIMTKRLSDSWRLSERVRERIFLIISRFFSRTLLSFDQCHFALMMKTEKVF